MRLLGRWLAVSAAFWVAAQLISGIKINGGFATYLWVALLFGLINTFLGSLLKLITLPATIFTFGLFLVVVNAAMLQLTARWSSKLDIANFWSAILASIVISIVTSFLGTFYKKLP